MKKYIVLILAAGLAFSSCRKNLQDINSDTKSASQGTVPGYMFFTSAQKELADFLSTPNPNDNIFRLVAQQWTQTTYVDESNYDLQTRSIPDRNWNSLYRDVLRNLKEAHDQIFADTSATSKLDPAQRINQLAEVDIMAVYTWNILVNTFGDVPYTEALDYKNLHPKYDDARTITNDLLDRLDNDIAMIDESASGFDGADMIFGLDEGQWGQQATSWKTFANSLKLKMGMMLADVDPTAAQALVESAVSAGVIASNAANVEIQYEGAQPNTNQIYVELVTTGRKDYVGSNTIIDMMNMLADPRLPIFFTDSAGTGIYVGGTYGSPNSYSKHSHPGLALLDPTLPQDLLDYAEVEFLLAEAVERGWAVSGTAEEHYNNAVTASIEYWGGSTADAALYLAQPEVAYTTATGTWQQKIGTQKWLALYNRGWDAWTEWRRLDYPIFNPPPGLTYGDIPVRFTYPVTEQNLNVAEYNAGAAAIGGDLVTTHLFWDIF